MRTNNISLETAQRLAGLLDDEQMEFTRLRVTRSDGDVGVMEGYYYGNKASREIFVSNDERVYCSPEYWFEEAL